MTFVAPRVWIYEVVREWVTHAWLCDACAATWKGTLRSRRLPPPRELVVAAAAGDAGARCDAAINDREPLACQGCHLAALPACPSCGGPAIYPGADSVTLESCRDPAHVQTSHVPAVQTLGTKSGEEKPRRKRGVAP